MTRKRRTEQRKQRKQPKLKDLDIAVTGNEAYREPLLGGMNVRSRVELTKKLIGENIKLLKESAQP